MESNERPFVITTLKSKSPLKYADKAFRYSRGHHIYSTVGTPLVEPQEISEPPYVNNEEKPNITKKHRILKKSVYDPIKVLERCNSMRKKNPHIMIRELKRHTNPRFDRMIDSAIEHFDYEKGKLKYLDDLKSESESFEDDNLSVDQFDFTKKKLEIIDIQKEIKIKEKLKQQQEGIINGLCYDIQNLKTRVQDPIQVKY